MDSSEKSNMEVAGGLTFTEKLYHLPRPFNPYQGGIQNEITAFRRNGGSSIEHIRPSNVTHAIGGYRDTHTTKNRTGSQNKIRTRTLSCQADGRKQSVLSAKNGHPSRRLSGCARSLRKADPCACPPHPTEWEPKVNQSDHRPHA